jgi:hypothetical protein
VPTGVSPGDVYITLRVAGGSYSTGPLHINAGSVPPQANPQPSTPQLSGAPVKVVVAPRVVSFSPAAGRVGARVDIQGANLSGASWVSFGGVRTTQATVLSSTALAVKVPKGARSGQLTVHASGGTANATKSFKVVRG